MTVRIATREDIDQLVELWLELMEYHAPMNPLFELTPDAGEIARAELLYRLQLPRVRIFVAESKDKKLEGMIITHYYYSSPTNTYCRRGYIAETVVRRTSRGRGVGNQLFAAARQWLFSLKVDFIELQVVPGNDLGMQFWKDQGFEILTCQMVLRPGPSKPERATAPCPPRSR